MEIDALGIDLESKVKKLDDIKRFLNNAHGRLDGWKLTQLQVAVGRCELLAADLREILKEAEDSWHSTKNLGN